MTVKMSEMSGKAQHEAKQAHKKQIIAKSRVMTPVPTPTTELNVPPPSPEYAEFTQEEIDLLLTNLNSYTLEEQAEIYKIVEELESQSRAELAHADLIEFCKLMQADYKVGKHHRILADLLMEIEQGKTYDQDGVEVEETGKDRICVNIPPRHGVTSSLPPTIS